MKNRAAIYQREAAEMLHNISLYPGLTENQLCRFFPEKEATAKSFACPYAEKRGASSAIGMAATTQIKKHKTAQIKTYPAAFGSLLDFIDQVEYHTVGEFPAAILCFANGELYEIVPIPQGKETMICQLLRQPQKMQANALWWSMMLPRLSCWTFPQVAGFCTVAEDGTVSYYKKEAALESLTYF